MTEFYGFPRPDGRVGVRNHVAVISSVFCANHVTQQIAAQVPGCLPVTHGVGCSQVGPDLEMTARTLKNIGHHPNAGAVLIVGLGCERFTPREFAGDLARAGKPLRTLIIQEAGGSSQAVARGVEYARSLVAEIAGQRRVPCSAAELTVGLECGGTDAASGIAANPSMGVVTDLLLGAGGSAIFSEVTELLGAEELLAARARDASTAAAIRRLILATEQTLARLSTECPARSALISTGNFDGGVTTVVEKALGNIAKTGSSPISGVLAYAERPPAKGLYLMDTAGHDGESVTGKAAGGAQIIIFSTGRGTPTGFPLVPVIKITGNSATYARMSDDLDFDCSPIIRGEETIADNGRRLWDELLAVANGKRTRAELSGNYSLMVVARSSYASCHGGG